MLEMFGISNNDSCRLYTLVVNETKTQIWWHISLGGLSRNSLKRNRFNLFKYLYSIMCMLFAKLLMYDVLYDVSGRCCHEMSLNWCLKKIIQLRIKYLHTPPLQFSTYTGFRQCSKWDDMKRRYAIPTSPGRWNQARNRYLYGLKTYRSVSS